MTGSKTKELLTTFKNLGRRRSPTQEFKNLLEIMHLSEEERQKNMQLDLNKNYKIWADHFQMLKEEFNSLWDFFYSIEQEKKGWFCVSPLMTSWKAVGHKNREGYLFAATIVKNVDRNAPLPTKSLAISFGIEEWGGGIGDERELGRVAKISDNLVGLEGCAGKSINDQYQESKRLVSRIGQFPILFRLNHKEIGQETARLDLPILEKQSLVELSEKLFILLNKDLLTPTGLSKEITGLNQKLLTKE